MSGELFKIEDLVKIELQKNPSEDEKTSLNKIQEKLRHLRGRKVVYINPKVFRKIIRMFKNNTTSGTLKQISYQLNFL